MKSILLIHFVLMICITGCMQTDNSHSSDKSRNETLQQIEEINDLIERIEDGDTSVELTVSQQAFTVINNNCLSCHYHESWQIEDSYWLDDSIYSYYISPHSSQPDNSRSARIIDRLAIYGTGTIWDDKVANMPQNGTLSEDDFNKLDAWVQYLINQKNNQ